jgi:hypothetical protein
VTSVVASASAGVLFGLSLVRVPNLVQAMEGLKRSGFWTVGLVANAGQTLYEIDVPSQVALAWWWGARRRTAYAGSPILRFRVRIPMAPGSSR